MNRDAESELFVVSYASAQGLHLRHCCACAFPSCLRDVCSEATLSEAVPNPAWANPRRQSGPKRGTDHMFGSFPVVDRRLHPRAAVVGNRCLKIASHCLRNTSGSPIYRNICVRASNWWTSSERRPVSTSWPLQLPTAVERLSSCELLKEWIEHERCVKHVKSEYCVKM